MIYEEMNSFLDEILKQEDCNLELRKFFANHLRKAAEVIRIMERRERGLCTKEEEKAALLRFLRIL